MSLQRDGVDPIVFDLGTGLRNLGRSWPADLPFRGHALVSHLHWDHIQGLPFFEPILRSGSSLDVYGPVTEGLRLAEAFDQFMRRPFFPVTVADLAGAIRFHDVEPGAFDIGDARVTVRVVPHTGRTFGYRVDVDGVSVAYISDHQQPGIDDHSVTPDVLELCRDVDLLIHDAQYDAAAFRHKATWGHCTVEYAVAVAVASGARRLALFHHDPAHDDARLAGLLDDARDRARSTPGLEVLLAVEDLSLELKGEGRVHAAEVTTN
ncbi:MAG TPA: MBL fold metallo-hydrolase [Acidimicrobiales bacterium]|nr:MBL fold metallo-hydrolase [Acidimicrobiales bacterium]